jgi:proteasome regulatory subunit
MLDRAILRPGRFDRLIEVPEPDHEGRVQILKIHTRDMNTADEVDFDALADRTDGYSGAEIESLTTEAGMFAIRDERTEVRMEDFEDALDKIEDDDSPGDTVSSGGYPDYAY